MLKDATNMALKARRDAKLVNPYSPLNRQRLTGGDDETNQVQSLTGTGASEKRPSLNKRPPTKTNEKNEWCILIFSNKQFRLSSPFDTEKSLVENYDESERIERSKWDSHQLSLSQTVNLIYHRSPIYRSRHNFKSRTKKRAIWYFGTSDKWGWWFLLLDFCLIFKPNNDNLIEMDRMSQIFSDYPSIDIETMIKEATVLKLEKSFSLRTSRLSVEWKSLSVNRCRRHCFDKATIVLKILNFRRP